MNPELVAAHDKYKEQFGDVFKNIPEQGAKHHMEALLIISGEMLVSLACILMSEEQFLEALQALLNDYKAARVMALTKLALLKASRTGDSLQ